MLNRDPSKRLGSGGGVEVQNHPFFSGLDWDLLYQRKVTPPYNPCKNQSTVANSSNFEDEFTSMPLQSVDDHSAASLALLNERPSTQFNDFTFDKDSAFDDDEAYYNAEEAKELEGLSRPHCNDRK